MCFTTVTATESRQKKHIIVNISGSESKIKNPSGRYFLTYLYIITTKFQVSTSKTVGEDSFLNSKIDIFGKSRLKIASVV